MSKAVKSVGKAVSGAVKSVGRAVSGVVRGATNVVRSVARGIGGVFRGIGRVLGRVVRSPIGRAGVAAATMYCGGAAIMGAIGGASAGTGFLGTIGGAVKGAGAGIANAWTGLTGAVTGGGLSSLSQGFTGAYGAGQGAVGGVQAVGMNLPAGAQASGAVTTPVGSSGVAGQALAPAAQGGGVVASTAPAAASGGLSPLAQYGLIQGVTQVAGGAIAGHGQQKALEEQRAYQDQKEAEERARQDESARTAFQFSDAEGTGSAGVQPMPVYDSTRFASGPAQLQNGLIGNQMYSSTLTSNRFPTFNPAYSRFV